MQKEKIAILTDSCGDIPPYLAEEYGIHVLPVHILYPEKEYTDSAELSAMIYTRFPKEIPHTSTPSLEEAKDAFRKLRDEEYTHVIAICISDHLSSTINTIRMAANEFPALHTYVFDTKNISIGSGIFAIWAAEKLAEGLSFAQITEQLPQKRKDVHLMFYMDTLTYLHAGGRLGNVSFLLASTLHLKPIISCNKNGEYYTVTKLRGSRQSKKRLLSELLKESKSKNGWFVIQHGNAPEEAAEMKALLLETIPDAKILFSGQITSSLAVHTGPGLLGLMQFIL